jgi:hypothetical protein
MLRRRPWACARAATRRVEDCCQHRTPQYLAKRELRPGIRYRRGQNVEAQATYIRPQYKLLEQPATDYTPGPSRGEREYGRSKE